jgi:hypothetical protein
LAAPTAQQPLERQKSAIARNDRALVFLLAVLVESDCPQFSSKLQPAGRKRLRSDSHGRATPPASAGASASPPTHLAADLLRCFQICLFAAAASTGHFLQHICFFVAMRHTSEKAAPPEVMRLSLVTNLK